MANEVIPLREYVDELVRLLRQEQETRWQNEMRIHGMDQAAFMEFRSDMREWRAQANEWRGQLRDQNNLYVTKAEATQMNSQMRDWQDRETALQNTVTGILASMITKEQLEARSRQMLTTASAVAGILAILFSFLGTFFPRWMPTPQPQQPSITYIPPQPASAPAVPVVPMTPK